MHYKEQQRIARKKQNRRRYLVAEAADGKRVRIGAPGVTFNAGRNAAKRKKREQAKTWR